MSRSGGQIEHCPHQNCGYTCCDFGANNFIELYPGELTEAVERGLSLSHLDCIPDGRGGYQAICRAHDRSDCDGGFKPLDCASYPLFPTLNQAGQLETGLKGEKCPLQQIHLRHHRIWVLRKWQELIDAVPDLRQWIRGTQLVGYVSWSNSSNSNLGSSPHRQENPRSVDALDSSS